MKKIQVLLGLFFTLALICREAEATSSPTLVNVTAAQFDMVAKELAGNFTYSSVNSGTTLGKIWGAEFGVVGGITRTPNIQSFVKLAAPSSNIKAYFPHASLMGRLSVPFGLTFEVMGIPKQTISGLSIRTYGGAAQWTVTDVFFSYLPFTIAAKGFYNATKFTYNQTFTDVNTGASIPGTVQLDNSSWGAQAMISKKLFIFDPYLALGVSSATGTLSVSAAGTVNLFANSYIPVSGSQTASAKPSSIMILAGTDIQVLFFSLGAEYMRAFGTASYTGRVSFRF